MNLLAFMSISCLSIYPSFLYVFGRRWRFAASWRVRLWVKSECDNTNMLHTVDSDMYHVCVLIVIDPHLWFIRLWEAVEWVIDMWLMFVCFCWVNALFIVWFSLFLGYVEVILEPIFVIKKKIKQNAYWRSCVVFILVVRLLVIIQEKKHIILQKV